VRIQGDTFHTMIYDKEFESANDAKNAIGNFL
jgi:hypothetical protein